MIEILPESRGNILIIKAEGKLTDRDYKDVFIPQLESVIREHGKARLLLEMGDDFHGWEAAAAWDDFRLGMTHRKDFEKMGVVGGPRWMEWCMKFGALFVNGEVKSFPASESETALSWIKQ
jgi:hypothetical protein